MHRRSINQMSSDHHLPSDVASALRALGLPRTAEEGTQHMDDILYDAARNPGTDIPSGFTYDNHFAYRTPGDCNNALHIAAQQDNSRFITATLDRVGPMHHYSLLCQKNSNGETPLHLAAKFGRKESFKALLLAHNHEGAAFNSFVDQRKPCWSEKDMKGDTPLHKALRNGHADIAMSLLDKDIQLVSVFNEAGESLAYLAAEASCNTVLQKILGAADQGILQQPIGFSGPFGLTVFHSLRRMTGDNPSIIVGNIFKLIEMRRNLLKEKDGKGKTVLHYAVEEGRIGIVNILLRVDSSLAYLQDNDGLTPLHMASSSAIIHTVTTIFDLSPQSVGIRDFQGKTVLHHFVKNGHEFLKECLKNKAIKELINEVDNEGNTPLHTALLDSKYRAAFDLLVVDGCNWRLKNNEGYSPFALCKSDDKISHKSLVYVGLEDLENGRKLRTRRRREDWSPLWRISLEGMEEKKVEALMDKLSAAAVLLLGVCFAGTFSVPGGYDQNTGYPIFGTKTPYRLYMLSEFVTFFSTASILIFYTFGHGKILSKKRLAILMIHAAQIAIVGTALAYFIGWAFFSNAIKSQGFRHSIPDIIFISFVVLLVFPIAQLLLSRPDE